MNNHINKRHMGSGRYKTEKNFACAPLFLQGGPGRMKCAQVMRKGQAEYSSAEFTSDAERISI